MLALVISLALMQQTAVCRDQAAPFVASALERGESFDLAGAADIFFAASGQWCIDAEIAGHYLRGLAAAREAYRQGGSPDSLAPVRLAVAALDARAHLAPALAATARAVVLAAAAAAQSERDEMALLLEHALRLENVQIEAGQPLLPVVTAHEAAGDLWLQVHRYEDANRAYQQALARVGPLPRVTLGLARSSARLKDADAACDHYRRLLAWWDTRRDEPPEIAEARAFVAQPACSSAPRP
jgi:tetratricopeptide (TPR) repeat protein